MRPFGDRDPCLISESDRQTNLADILSLQWSPCIETSSGECTRMLPPPPLAPIAQVLNFSFKYGRRKRQKVRKAGEGEAADYTPLQQSSLVSRCLIASGNTSAEKKQRHLALSERARRSKLRGEEFYDKSPLTSDTSKDRKTLRQRSRCTSILQSGAFFTRIID